MTSRHERLQELFLGAAEVPAPERTRYLESACNDSELRAEVEELLAAEQDSGNFLAATAMAEHQSWLTGGGCAADPVPTPHRIGNYDIHGVLGEGGMGIVYRAQQERPAREVALKVLRPGSLDPQRLHRLEAEAELLGRLQHPGIAQVFEAGTFEQGGEQLPYFAMELIEGVPVLEYAQAQELDLHARLQLVLRIADAVQHAHQRGVVHRDLKPGNILVDRRGQPRVLDFGVSARIEEGQAERPSSGQLVGTLPYMAPEQLSGSQDVIDPRVDVYALGVLLYQLVANELPIPVEGKSAAGMMLAVLHDPPRPLREVAQRAPQDLEHITARALSKQPEERYDSAAGMAEDLRRFLAREPIRARAATPAYVLRCFLARNAGLVAAGSLVLTILLVSGTALVLKTVEAAENDRVARSKAEEATVTAELAAQKALEAQASAERANQVRDFVTSQIRLLFNAEQDMGPSVDLSTVLEAVLRNAEDQLSATPGDQALVLREIGRSHASRWELPQAEEVNRRALALGRAEFGPFGEFCLEVGNDLALVLRDQDRRPEAIELLEELLAGGRALHGEDHAQVLRLRHNRALLHKDFGEFEVAEREYRQVLERRTQLFGAEDEATLDTRGALTEVLVTLGRTHEALENLEAVFEAQQRVLDAPRRELGLGPDPETLLTMEQLADLYRELGRFDEALPLLQQAVAERIQLYGLAHDHTLASHYKLARTLIDRGTPDEGEEVLLRALEASLELHGADHLSTAFLRGELGRALRLQGRYAEAEQQVRLALEIRQRRYPPGHVTLGFGQAELGRVQLADGRAREALLTYDSALATLEPSLEDDNWHLNVIRAERGGVLQALGRNDEARDVLEPSIAAVEAALGEHERLDDLRAWLAAAYDALDEPVLATELRARMDRD